MRHKIGSESQYAVGQKLWYVPVHGTPRFIEISKVGRVWLTFCELGCDYTAGRLHIDGLCADGGEYTSPGRAYVSREKYEAECRFLAAWKAFRQTVDRMRIPVGITLEDIGVASKALGIVELEDGK